MANLKQQKNCPYISSPVVRTFFLPTRERTCQKHPRHPTDGNQHARRACVGCVAVRARPQGARTPARGKEREPAAMKSEESGERVAARPNRKRRNRERAAMRRALAHTDERERRRRGSARDGLPALGRSRQTRRGKRLPPLASEERPNDPTETY